MGKREDQLQAQMAARFAALGAPVRLRLLRLLVQAGDDGLSIGRLLTFSGLAASTQAHHLRVLVSTGLVVQVKLGREVQSRAHFQAVRSLGEYLFDRCCMGLADRSQALPIVSKASGVRS